MSSLSWELHDLAQRPIMFWLPPGGTCEKQGADV